jgi:hypothetical protein
VLEKKFQEVWGVDLLSSCYKTVLVPDFDSTEKVVLLFSVPCRSIVPCLLSSSVVGIFLALRFSYVCLVVFVC